MATSEIYSKRQKRQRGELPEIFAYDNLPEPLRIQIIKIARDATGSLTNNPLNQANDHKVLEVYEHIEELLLREYGKEQLLPFSLSNSLETIHFYIKSEKSIEHVLDAIELLFELINIYIPSDEYQYAVRTIRMKPTEAIEELNERFKEHGVGYQFVPNEIIRLDSTFSHSEIVLETLNLIANPKFRGANEEYLKAHEHYRHGRNQECINECLKAFESTMKIICSSKGWAYNQTDNASKLINICLSNNLIPNILQSQLGALSSLLASGVPTIRNKTSGHGQGPSNITVGNELTRYTLNLTGSNILLLAESSGL